MSKDVFISYSSKDEKIANEVRQLFEKENLSCWIASDSIKTGDYFAKEIMSAIEETNLFVLIFSKNSKSSEYVLKEVEAAYEKNKAMIAFLVDGTLPEGAMQFALNDKQWLHAYPKPQEHYDKLISDAKRMYGDVLDGRYQDPGPIFHQRPKKKTFFEEHKTSVAVGVAVAIIAIVAIVAFTGVGFNSGDTASPTITIDYVGVEDYSSLGYSWKYLYGVYGSFSSNVNDTDVIHIDYCDDSGNVVFSNETKVKDIDDTTLGLGYAEKNNIAKVSVELKDNAGKVLASAESSDVLNQ